MHNLVGEHGIPSYPQQLESGRFSKYSITTPHFHQVGQQANSQYDSQKGFSHMALSLHSSFNEMQGQNPRPL